MTFEGGGVGSFLKKNILQVDFVGKKFPVKDQEIKKIHAHTFWLPQKKLHGETNTLICITKFIYTLVLSIFWLSLFFVNKF